jgi:hypothetical protein
MSTTNSQNPSPFKLRKAVPPKRKPLLEDDDSRDNSNPCSQNPFEEFSQSPADSISLQKAPCEEQSNSQSSFPRRRLQRISDRRQNIEIRYEEENNQPESKINNEVCEIEYTKPSYKIETELENLVSLFTKCSQSSSYNKPIVVEQESNIIECEDASEDEQVIEEEEEDIVPKKSLAEIPDPIRINSLFFVLVFG